MDNSDREDEKYANNIFEVLNSWKDSICNLPSRLAIPFSMRKMEEFDVFSSLFRKEFIEEISEDIKCLVFYFKIRVKPGFVKWEEFLETKLEKWKYEKLFDQLLVSVGVDYHFVMAVKHGKSFRKDVRGDCKIRNTRICIVSGRYTTSPPR